MKPLSEELRMLLTGYNMENNSNTPDFILAKYLERCLDAFDEATRARDAWYAVNLEPGNVHLITKGEAPYTMRTEEQP